MYTTGQLGAGVRTDAMVEFEYFQSRFLITIEVFHLGRYLRNHVRTPAVTILPQARQENYRLSVYTLPSHAKPNRVSMTTPNDIQKAEQIRFNVQMLLPPGLLLSSC